jgi:hypothetical protein
MSIPFQIGQTKYTDNGCTLTALTTGYALPYIQGLNTSLFSNSVPGVVVNQNFSVNNLIHNTGSIASSIVINTGAQPGSDGYSVGTSDFFVFWDCFSTVVQSGSCNNCICNSSRTSCQNQLGKFQTQATELALLDCPDPIYLGSLIPAVAASLLPSPIFLSGSASNVYPCSECLTCIPGYLPYITV